MQNDPINQWYKQQASNSVPPVSPPDHIWEGIAGALDGERKATFVKRFGIWSACCFLVVSGGLFYFFSGDAKADQQLAFNADGASVYWLAAEKESIASGEAETGTTDHAHQNLANNLPTEIEGDQVEQANVQNTRFAQGNSDIDAAFNSTATLSADIEALDEMEVQQPGLAVVLDAQPETVTVQPYAYESRIEFPLGLYGGIQLSLDNVWSLNHDTYNGLDAQSLVLNKTKFSGGLALVAGHQYAMNHGVQAELQLLKSQGQRFGFYREGRYFENNLQLSYTGVNLLYKYRKINTERIYPSSTVLMVGGYGYYQRSASRTIGGVDLNVSDEYTAFDAGLVLGLEHERMIGSNVSLSAGLRTNVGLLNVFKGNAEIPGHFNVTRNLSFNALFGVRYHIVKK